MTTEAPYFYNGKERYGVALTPELQEEWGVSTLIILHGGIGQNLGDGPFLLQPSRCDILRKPKGEDEEEEGEKEGDQLRVMFGAKSSTTIYIFFVFEHQKTPTFGEAIHLNEEAIYFFSEFPEIKPLEHCLDILENVPLTSLYYHSDRLFKIVERVERAKIDTILQRKDERSSEPNSPPPDEESGSGADLDRSDVWGSGSDPGEF